MVDTGDLKSPGPYRLCGFESHFLYQNNFFNPAPPPPPPVVGAIIQAGPIKYRLIPFRESGDTVSIARCLFFISRIVGLKCRSKNFEGFGKFLLLEHIGQAHLIAPLAGSGVET